MLYLAARVESLIRLRELKKTQSRPKKWQLGSNKLLLGHESAHLVKDAVDFGKMPFHVSHAGRDI